MAEHLAVLDDEQVASMNGDYTSFTGVIRWNGTEARVKGASFLLFNEGMVWRRGIFLEGTLTHCEWMEGVFMDGAALGITWHGGSFISGLMSLDSVFMDGAFMDGAMTDSTFQGGAFMGGVLTGCTITGGVLMGGRSDLESVLYGGTISGCEYNGKVMRYKHLR